MGWNREKERNNYKNQCTTIINSWDKECPSIISGLTNKNYRPCFKGFTNPFKYRLSFVLLTWGIKASEVQGFTFLSSLDSSSLALLTWGNKSLQSKSP